MTTKLKWRLGKLPSPDEVRELVKDKIITQEEARDILFNTETDDERDANSLKEEIKFLREIIDNLSKNNRSQLIETIRYVEKPYLQYYWNTPYVTYCASGGIYAINSVATTGASLANCSSAAQQSGLTSGTNYQTDVNGNDAFTSIQTF